MGMKSSKRRSKPSDPAEIARRRMEAMAEEARKAEIAARAQRDPCNWGISQDLASLAENDDIDLRKDVTGKITRAKRWDVFSLLRATYRKGDDGVLRPVLSGDHVICVDRLHRLMAIRHHTMGASSSQTPIDGLVALNFPKAAVEAGVKIDGLFAFMDSQEPARNPYRARMIATLSEPQIAHGRRVNNWRDVVKRISGEERDREQVDEVVRACDALEHAMTSGADASALDAYYKNRQQAA